MKSEDLREGLAELEWGGDASAQKDMGHTLSQIDLGMGMQAWVEWRRERFEG